MIYIKTIKNNNNAIIKINIQGLSEEGGDLEATGFPKFDFAANFEFGFEIPPIGFETFEFPTEGRKGWGADFDVGRGGGVGVARIG